MVISISLQMRNDDFNWFCPVETRTMPQAVLCEHFDFCLRKKQRQPGGRILWMDEILHHLRNP